MNRLRALWDSLRGRHPQEAQEPQLTPEQEYEAERKRELLKKHEERVESGEAEEGRYQDV